MRKYWVYEYEYGYIVIYGYIVRIYNISYSLEILLRVSSISLWFYVFRSMSLYSITQECVFVYIEVNDRPLYASIHALEYSRVTLLVDPVTIDVSGQCCMLV